MQKYTIQLLAISVSPRTHDRTHSFDSSARSSAGKLCRTEPRSDPELPGDSVSSERFGLRSSGVCSGALRRPEECVAFSEVRAGVARSEIVTGKSTDVSEGHADGERFTEKRFRAHAQTRTLALPGRGRDGQMDDARKLCLNCPRHYPYVFSTATHFCLLISGHQGSRKRCLPRSYRADC